jgi:hypothetical protein
MRSGVIDLAFVINPRLWRYTSMRPICSRALLVTLATAVLCACGVSNPRAAQPSPTLTTLSCTSSGQASPLFASPAAPAITPPIVSAVAAGDTLTLTFAQGTPTFEVKTQPSSHFIAGSGRGTWVDVPGSAGAEITLSGFRGDIQNYTGSTSIKSQGPLLLEVRHISEFEGYVDWVVGLSDQACANVIASGSTLTFQFVPASKTAAAPIPVAVAGAQRAALALFVEDPSLNVGLRGTTLDAY